jgi:phosphate starvation-inducible PhoH-like protein
MDDHPLPLPEPHSDGRVDGDVGSSGPDSGAAELDPHVIAHARPVRPESRHTIVVPAEVPMVALLGPGDELLRTIERAFPRLDVHVRGNEWTVTGPAAEAALLERLVDELLAVIAAGQPLSRDAVDRSVSMLRQQTTERPADVLTLNILSNRGKKIRPKTLNQKRYVDAIDDNTVVFGIGPAGTGKTYLAMAKAVQALQAKRANRIILTRPAVEAGERLGFLPGTLTEKIDPYLRPLYDALHDMLDPDSIPRLMAAGTIEVAPLAYMRGRTLNDAFIILDEAQNTSAEQMKMFLTRLGFGSKIVVTGDVTQVDLPSGTQSGLRIVREILDGIDDVHFAELTSQDVVRHRLVGDIVDAYGRWDALNADRDDDRRRPQDHRESSRREGSRAETRAPRHPRSAEGRR